MTDKQNYIILSVILGVIAVLVILYLKYAKADGGDYAYLPPPDDGTIPIGSPALFQTNANYPGGLKGVGWGLASWSIIDGSGTITLEEVSSQNGSKVGIRIYGIDANGHKVTFKELYPLFGYGPGQVNYSFAYSSATKFTSYHIDIDRYYSILPIKNIKIVAINGGILVLK